MVGGPEGPRERTEGGSVTTQVSSDTQRLPRRGVFSFTHTIGHTHTVLEYVFGNVSENDERGAQVDDYFPLLLLSSRHPQVVVDENLGRSRPSQSH